MLGVGVSLDPQLLTKLALILSGYFLDLREEIHLNHKEEPRGPLETIPYVAVLAGSRGPVAEASISTYLQLVSRGFPSVSPRLWNIKNN